MLNRALPLTLASFCLMGAPASAITNGTPDDGRHPYVGALVTHDGKGRKHQLICTGTLVSPTAFVTAAHCLVGEPTDLFVSFDAFVGAPDVGPEVALHPGTATGHPQFVDETAPGDTHDLAVVRLDPPVEGIAPAELPTPDRLAEPHGTRYDLVGYGREGRTTQGFYGGGTRHFATGPFASLEPFKLMMDQTGTNGGTCNGDSGGPVLLEGSRTVVAVVSDGDPECAVSSVNYRLDTESARAFLDDFVPVPPPPPPPPAPTPTPAPSATPAPTVTPPPVVVAPKAVISAAFRPGRVTRLRVSGVPAGGRVELRCRKPRRARRGCGFTRRVFTGRTTVDLLRAFRTRRLPAGTRIHVVVSAPGAATVRAGWRITRTGARRI